MKKVAVIGIGNILFSDEGAGVYAARYLEKNYAFDPVVEIVDGGTLGLGLAEYFLTCDCVVLIDTLSVDEAPGSVFLLPSEELLGLGNHRKTAHEVEVIGMLEICMLEGMRAEVWIVGIVPADIASVGIGLSAPVRKNFQMAVETVLRVLDRCNVTVHPIERGVGIDGIVGLYG